MKFSSFISLVFGLMLAPGAQDNSPPKDKLADFIMQRVLSRAKENDEKKRNNLVFRKIVTVENLKNHKIEKKEIFLVYGEEGRTIEKLVEENGCAVNQKKKSIPLELNEQILDRFVFEMAEPEIIIDNDRPYYTINFRPKDNLTADKWEDHFLNELEGMMLVDIEKFFLKKLSSHLRRKVSVGWGIFEMSHLEINFEQEEYGDLIVSKSASATVKYRIFWSSSHKQYHFQYTDFKHQNLDSFYF